MRGFMGAVCGESVTKVWRDVQAMDSLSRRRAGEGRGEGPAAGGVGRMSRVSEQPRFHRDNVPAARRLRRLATESEELLWSRLRGRQLNRLKWRRQHPIGPFVVDFYCEWARLAVEIDGGVHSIPAVALRDRDRQAWLEAEGIRVVRVSSEQVLVDLEGVLTLIAAHAG